MRSEKKTGGFAELRAFIRASLQSQHPEWIQPDGNSPMCDEYDARLVYVLGLAKGSEEKAVQ